MTLVCNAELSEETTRGLVHQVISIGEHGTVNNEISIYLGGNGHKWEREYANTVEPR